MNKTFIALAIALLGFANNSSAQIHCHTDEYNAELAAKHPDIAKRKAAYTQWLTEVNQQPKTNKKATIYTIPVVFHIIHTYGPENISKDQIMDQMRVLNEDFSRTNSDTFKTRSIFKSIAADCQIRFELAKKDPNGNCTDGINRIYSELTDGGDDAVKSLIHWDYRKYLNIYIVKDIDRNSGDGGRVLGYATLPYATNANTDGIVMLYDYTGTIGESSTSKAGRVLTHEVGHWLGLLHPFNYGCGNQGDGINDTPPVAEPSFGCDHNSNTCSNDNPDLIDMVENFMDYADGSCQNAFTEGQKAVMHGNLTNNSRRGLNVSTANLATTGVSPVSTDICNPVADFIATDESLVICEGQAINFKDISYGGPVDNLLWEFEGGSPLQSTFEEVEVTYNAAGTYKVTLTASNSTGSDDKTRDAYITVLPSTSNTKAQYNQGFENEELTQMFNIDNSSDEDYGWRTAVGNGYNGTNGIQCYFNTGTEVNSRYYLEFPPLDIRSLEDKVTLSFRMAYTQAVDDNASEAMFIQVSRNCGESWTSVQALRFFNGIVTNDNFGYNYVPSGNSDWNQFNIDLSQYSGEPNIFIRFEALSNAENPIYIDDIQVGKFSLATPNKQIDQNQWTVYPNPTQDYFQLKIQDIVRDEPLNISILDAGGRAVFIDNEVKDVENWHSPQLSKGVYFILLQYGEKTYREKIVVY